MVSVDELLKRMDGVDWSKVPYNGTFKHRKKYFEQDRERFQHYLDIMKENNVSLEGEALDLESGAVSFATVYPRTIALDYQLETIKVLRENGVKAVHGDITKMEFDENSFDIVMSFFPGTLDINKSNPAQPAGYKKPVSWHQKFVHYTSGIAKKNIILHDTFTNNGYKNCLDDREFLGLYKIANVRSVPIEKGHIIHIMDK